MTTWTRDEIVYWLAVVYANEVDWPPSLAGRSMTAVLRNDRVTIEEEIMQIDEWHQGRDEYDARLRRTVAALLREALK